MTNTDVRASARRFFAATSREALRLVREALGDEAIVLSNRASAQGVEIVAMVEGEVAQAVAVAERAAEPAASVAPIAPAASAPVAPAMQAAPQAAPAAPIALQPAARPAAPVAESPSAAVPAVAPTASSDAVLNELHSMRGMLEEQLAGALWNDQQRQDPARGRLLRTLLGAGFSARLSRAMLEKLPTGQTYAQGLAFARSELIRAMPVMQDEEALMRQGGVYALMGPTGVGKTTTTAKLAARCVMRFGADKLALVTTDSFRIGAYEQLRIYGQILGVPVYAVKDAADLHLVLQDLQGKHMVLIDTVGMSQRDRALSEQIAMLCNARRPVKRMLLLNATSHGDTLNEVVHAYRQGSDLAGCIFTKVDESTHPGALIDTAIRHRLPVHYVSSGQKVPENLMVADPAQLVDSVFQPRRHQPLFVPPETEMREAPEGTGPSAGELQAQAEADRLRHQYQNLIRAMAHDAQELAGTAASLSGAGIGFDTARRLWRRAGDEHITQQALLQVLAAQAQSEIASGCSRHVLAVYGRVSLRTSEGGDAYACHSSLLLSDRSGLAIAAPNQWLSTAGTRGSMDKRRRAEARQVQWLDAQANGKPVVHLLGRLPSLEALQEWQAQGLRWLARASAVTGVIDAQGGQSYALARLPFDYGDAVAITHRGKPAVRREAHLQVLLRAGPEAAELKPLRCVAVRVMDARTHKILAQHYLLSNLEHEVDAAQLAQWHGWATDAEACLRLMRQGVQLAGGLGEPGDPAMVKRLLVAGQVGTTVWRLMHAQGEWAARARTLLGQLTGRTLRGGQAPSGNQLYLGVTKLFLLLDALGTESTAPTRQLVAVANEA
ncbi:flagellar biosynthesis protein FlhF [Variovorax dokdonensis]|uniref:Flagellar biosynthesis protein FlhF n=1 Tax=Variovorax dokdonensis TaxID=344883 RepID=A0ABT7N4W8_9BURK|nr:flagellar biosynthesis protein FlhF [Variovorax dokdonensis]MDM0042988.1 flagellar biosynthesis protein FlhF [Variovorax dokdonensis]